MKPTETKVSKKSIYYAIGLVIFVILLVLAIQSPLSILGLPPNAETMGSPDFIAGSPERFALLSGQGGQRSVGST